VSLKLLDLFCGGGGAGMGYHQSGFDVVGVDVNPQPRYPFEFHQADALQFLLEHGREFDVIHASPPCQAYSEMQKIWNNRDEHPDLIEPTREILIASEKPYVIENVVGAPLRVDLMLCGTMFGLRIIRHRIFESNISMPLLTLSCNHTDVYDPYHGQNRTANKFRDALGINWLPLGGGTNKIGSMDEAIPPAYTKFIGGHLANTALLSNTACTRQGEEPRQNDLFATGSDSVSSDGTSPAPCG